MHARAPRAPLLVVSNLPSRSCKSWAGSAAFTCVSSPMQTVNTRGTDLIHCWQQKCGCLDAFAAGCDSQQSVAKPAASLPCSSACDLKLCFCGCAHISKLRRFLTGSQNLQKARFAILFPQDQKLAALALAGQGCISAKRAAVDQEGKPVGSALHSIVGRPPCGQRLGSPSGGHVHLLVHR